jgi:hypothetical protein
MYNSEYGETNEFFFYIKTEKCDRGIFSGEQLGIWTFLEFHGLFGLFGIPWTFWNSMDFLDFLEFHGCFQLPQVIYY